MATYVIKFTHAEPVYIQAMSNSPIQQTVNIQKNLDAKAGTITFTGSGEDNTPMTLQVPPPSFMTQDTSGRYFFTPTAGEKYDVSISSAAGTGSENVLGGSKSTRITGSRNGTFHMQWVVGEEQDSSGGDFNDSVCLFLQWKWDAPPGPKPRPPKC